MYMLLLHTETPYLKNSKFNPIIINMKYLNAAENNRNKVNHVFDQGAKNNFSLPFQQYCSTLPPVDYHVEVLFAVKPLPTGRGRYCCTKPSSSNVPLNIIFF